jgi:hypothetical protein
MLRAYRIPMNMRKGQQEALGIGFNDEDSDDMSLSNIKAIWPC